MIKLIASDIDGTLFRSNHTLPEEFDDVLQILNENHIIFSVASGRPYLTLQKTFEKYKDILFIADNGAHVVYQGKELSVHSFDTSLIKKLLTITRQVPDSYAVLCTTEGAFIESSNPDFIRELEKYYVKYTIVSDLTQVQKHFIKYTVCDLTGAEKHSLPYYSNFTNNIQISVAGFVWLDMMPKGVNKGTAIKEIQSKLNISFEEIMTFGDYLNDSEMLQSAYYSYAMENAHKDLFEIARFKAASNDDDGVILKIKEMLNNRFVPID